MLEGVLRLERLHQLEGLDHSQLLVQQVYVDTQGLLLQ